MTTSRVLFSLVLVTLSVGCGSDDGGGGDGDCNVGSEGCACTAGGACDSGLTCASDLCVDLGSDADVDTDGDTDADTDADTDTDTDTDTGTIPATTCADYCTAVVAYCAEPQDQYPEGGPQEICEGFCGILEPGTPGETTGDTIECRASHALLTIENPEAECPMAGPFGAGECGESQCDVFCRAMQILCTGEYQQYGSEAECLAACTKLPDADEPFYFDFAERGASFRCRGHRLTVAAIDDPALHCGPAAGVGFCNTGY